MPFAVILFCCSLNYSSGRNFSLSFDINVFQLKGYCRERNPKKISSQTLGSYLEGRTGVFSCLVDIIFRET